MVGMKIRRDFGWEGFLVKVILEERKLCGPAFFLFDPPFFNPPNWRENGKEKGFDRNYPSAHEIN